jgi:acyl-coenzyme A synthetase/AMP-(fatty) acid ligase
MVWESFDGSRRELVWGELQDMADQAAAMLREHGVGRGDRVAVVLPPRPRLPPSSSASGSWGRCCSRCRCSTATMPSATVSMTPGRAWS